MLKADKKWTDGCHLVFLAFDCKQRRGQLPHDSDKHVVDMGLELD